MIDDRGVTVVLHYGLCEMPENGYQPRYADTRVGHFLTAVKDFAKDNPDTSFVRMVNRWRLERADGSSWKEGGKLVPPKKRSSTGSRTRYRTSTARPCGKASWNGNKAFEKVGFKDAIEVRQQDGQEFDPEDVTYGHLPVTTRDYGGAIGPSRANPLTGEILDADILFDGGFVQLYKQEFKLFRDDAGRPVEPGSLIQAQHKGWDLPFHPAGLPGQPVRLERPGRAGRAAGAARSPAVAAAGGRPPGYCQCAAHKRGELAPAGFSALAMRARGEDDKPPPKKRKRPGDEDEDEKPKAKDKPKPEDDKKGKDKSKSEDDEDKPGNPELEKLLQQAIKEIAMHEVGHTLGLRHNFKASTMLANKDLHNTEITARRGWSGR